MRNSLLLITLETALILATSNPLAAQAPIAATTPNPTNEAAAWGILDSPVAGGLLFRGSERNKTRSLAKTPVRTESKGPTAVQVEAPTNDATLTDEQLLAFFPADSCFIAEADGRKILVFRSPELRQKYFH